MDSNEQDGSAPDKSKSIRSANESSENASTLPAGLTCGSGRATAMNQVIYGPTNRKGERTFHPLALARQVNASHTTQQAGLICSAEASPAKTSLSPASGRDSQANAPASSGRSSASPRSSAQRGDSSRMFQGFLAVNGEPICPPSSRGFGSAGLSSATGFWTADISESPRDGVGCSLSAVLQKKVSPRYFLSPRAAQGIRRRAGKRGRELPEQLRAALSALATASTRMVKNSS